MLKLHHRAPTDEEPHSGRAAGYRRPKITFRPIAALGWLFITFVLATGPLQLAVPNQSGSAYFSAAGLGGLAVLGAVLASDLRRARSMTYAGQTVERVEVGLLRGRVVATGEVATPQGLRRVSWAGPAALVASALALAAVGGLFLLATSKGFDLLGATALISAAGIGALGLAELLPAPGSAGSQLVFAREWRRSGRRDTAVVKAARAGVGSGWAMVVAGVAVLLLVSFAGIWFILVGGMAIAGSRLTLAGAQTRQRLAGLRASDVMSAPPPEVSAFSSADAAFTEVALPSRADLLIVRDTDGSFGGIVAAQALAAVPGDDRDSVRVRRLAIPPAAIATVTPTDPVEQVLDAIAAHPGIGLAVVVDSSGDTAGPGAGAPVVGIITPADLTRTVSLLEAANPMNAPARKRL
jgi:CBS domain-containing protein